MYDSFKHHRRSVRFRGSDYQSAGAYFITICAEHHRPFFGHIEDGVMKSNWVGKIVEQEWLRTSEVRPEIELDEYMVMPNHFHAIVLVTQPVGAHGCVPSASDTEETPHKNVPKRRPRSLSSLVAQYKAAVTRAVNAKRATCNQSPVIVWQRSFHDRIIRNESELIATRRYIIENPINWASDEYS
jgi:REP element-mobilizing transposase RayT